MCALSGKVSGFSVEKDEHLKPAYYLFECAESELQHVGSSSLTRPPALGAHVLTATYREVPVSLFFKNLTLDSPQKWNFRNKWMCVFPVQLLLMTLGLIYHLQSL